MNIRRTVFCGLFSALIFAATFVTKFPIVGAGYVNLGDAVIIISAIALGPYYGTVSALIGATTADFISGYAVYAPMTFVIKGLMAVAVSLISGKVFGKKFCLRAIISAVVSEIIMVLGYFVFQWLIMGFVISITDIIPNIIQGAVCVFASSLCIVLVDKNSSVKDYIGKI